MMATIDDFEITPEMIKAGVEEFFSRRRFPWEDVFDEESAARVYRAMHHALQSQHMETGDDFSTSWSPKIRARYHVGGG